MIIYLATDHAGFALKEKVKKFLIDSGYTVEDCGAHTLNPDDDYPDFIRIAAEAVSKCEQEKKETGDLSRACRAIIFGGSGQGEAMVANRIKRVRAVVYYGEPSVALAKDEEPKLSIIKLSREHNDANILSIGARFMSEKKALQAIDLWLTTSFSEEERHKRRIDNIG